MNPDGTHVVHVEVPRGSYKCKVDEKGRLKLPAAIHHFFVRIGQNLVFATTLDQKSAWIYMISEWQKNEVVFDEYQQNPTAARNLWFLANHFGADCTIDTQGRIPLPDVLRQELKLDGADTWIVREKGHFALLKGPQYAEQLEKSKADGLANLAEMAHLLR